MDIGQPRKTIVIAPLELPVPRKRESPATPAEPVVVAPPEREPVPA